MLNLLLQVNCTSKFYRDTVKCLIQRGFGRMLPCQCQLGLVPVCVLQYYGICCVEWACSPSSISKFSNRSRIIIHLLRWGKYSNSKSGRYHRKASCIRPPRCYIAPQLKAELFGQTMFWNFTKQVIYVVWGTDVPGWRERCFYSQNQRKVWNSLRRLT